MKMTKRMTNYPLQCWQAEKERRKERSGKACDCGCGGAAVGPNIDNIVNKPVVRNNVDNSINNGSKSGVRNNVDNSVNNGSKPGVRDNVENSANGSKTSNRGITDNVIRNIREVTTRDTNYAPTKTVGNYATTNNGNNNNDNNNGSRLPGQTKGPPAS